MDEKGLFRELMDNGHIFVWYLREPGVSNPDGNFFILQKCSGSQIKLLWSARDSSVPASGIAVVLHPLS